jgi:hypothetical protein
VREHALGLLDQLHFIETSGEQPIRLSQGVPSEFVKLGAMDSWVGPRQTDARSELTGACLSRPNRRRIAVKAPA